jgi:hypothetical protein
MSKNPKLETPCRTNGSGGRKSPPLTSLTVNSTHARGYYKGKGDKLQNLTPSAVSFLADKKVTGAISFNENKHIHGEKERPQKVSLAPCHQLHHSDDAPTRGSLQIPL